MSGGAVRKSIRYSTTHNHNGSCLVHSVWKAGHHNHNHNMIWYYDDSRYRFLACSSHNMMTMLKWMKWMHPFPRFHFPKPSNSFIPYPTLAAHSALIAHRSSNCTNQFQLAHQAHHLAFAFKPSLMRTVN